MGAGVFSAPSPVLSHRCTGPQLWHSLHPVSQHCCRLFGYCTNHIAFKCVARADALTSRWHSGPSTVKAPSTSIAGLAATAQPCAQLRLSSPASLPTQLQPQPISLAVPNTPGLCTQLQPQSVSFATPNTSSAQPCSPFHLMTPTSTPPENCGNPAITTTANCPPTATNSLQPLTATDHAPSSAYAPVLPPALTHAVHSQRDGLQGAGEPVALAIHAAHGTYVSSTALPRTSLPAQATSSAQPSAPARSSTLPTQAGILCPCPFLCLDSLSWAATAQIRQRDAGAHAQH